MNEKYIQFIKSKHVAVKTHGFEYERNKLPASMFGWQKDIVLWALRSGRAALFEDCGLGKTVQQLAWCKAVAEHTGRSVLLLTPLAVGPQTVKEAAKFGIDCPVRLVRDSSHADEGIVVCNYENQHNLDFTKYAGVCLDESSILKSYMGATKRALVEACRDVPYRLCATATPAPNDVLELGNHADFLGIMESHMMICRWFDNDSMTAGGYTLKPHATKDFWKWVASWAICVSKPSDLGHSDEGYDLPPLNPVYVRVQIPAAADPTGEELFSNADLTATSLHIEKRASAPIRADKAADIVNATTKQVIVWCDTNYEADELMKRIPDAIEVRGTMKDEVKAANLEAFTEGRARVIVTKPEIAGHGLNWQHCHVAVFVGLSFSYERFYQAIRRCYRFGQKNQVDAYIIESDVEQAIAKTVNIKSIKHEAMKAGMAEAMKAAQAETLYGRLTLEKSTGLVRHDGDGYSLYHGDCVEATKQLEDNSIGLSVYSPPFSNLYTYSASMEDMGNSADDQEFIEHYKFLIKDLLRVTIPGRLSVVHCKDMPMYKGRDGAAGLRDFPGMIIRAHEELGWTYHSRVTIWKDPVIEMQRTKNHGLLHKMLCKDSCNSRQGMADYLIVFRKWTDSVNAFPDPVVGKSEQVRFDSYVGTEPPTETVDARTKSIQVWQRYASPVWFDIDQTNVLNYRDGRGENDTKHICPLQLDVIERAVHLWSNIDDLVYSPFNGIGSEGYVSLKMNRNYIGAELKKEYVDVALDNLNRAVRERDEVGKNSLFAGKEA